MELFDLEKNFAFYGAYHSNPINILIHLLFVWPVLFTAQMLLYFTPPLFFKDNDGGNGLIELFGQRFLVLNIGFFLTMLFGFYYVCLDKRAGSLAALMCFLSWVGSSFLSDSLGYSVAWKVALVTQLLCWTGQFIGHGVFEKRAPALLDNLAQAFLMAPFFVLLEALDSSLSYEPYPGFHARVKAKIAAEIKEWRDKKQNKAS